MKIIRKDDPPKEDRTNAPIFFGGKVTGQSIVGPDMNEYFNFTMVSFAAGRSRPGPGSLSAPFPARPNGLRRPSDWDSQRLPSSSTS